MHLPGPIRAAVGFVASAADEVKHLPDRAVELPMLAVSTALQMSLRAQQRYARLAARGDAVLNREQAGAEPPQWATFDEPVSTEELRRAAMAQLDSLSGGGTGNSRFFDELFGANGAAAAADAVAAAAGTVDDGPSATVTPISQAPTAEARSDAAATTPAAPPRKAPAKKTSAEKAPAKKAPAKKAAAKKAAATTAPAKAPAKAPATKAGAKKAAAKTTATKTPATKTADVEAADVETAAPKSASEPSATPVDDTKGKTVSKPRHTAPSKFDDVGDD